MLAVNIGLAPSCKATNVPQPVHWEDGLIRKSQENSTPQSKSIPFVFIAKYMTLEPIFRFQDDFAGATTATHSSRRGVVLFFLISYRNSYKFVLTFECQASSCQLRTSTQTARIARPSFKVKKLRHCDPYRFLQHLCILYYFLPCDMSRNTDSARSLWNT